MNAVNVTGDIVAAATALAGLTLVFLGGIATSFDQYDKQQQATVRGGYQRRAWFAFAGFALALLSAVVALVAKGLNNECGALIAAALLLLAFVWVMVAAIMAVLDIR
jgi:peptidoglycan/LPS O-acetylase OafA/YrhL